MANKKISEMTEATVFASDDELAIVDKSDTTGAASGTTKRTTLTSLASAAAALNPAAVNTESNGGNPTLKVAPEDTAQVSSLTDSSNANYDFTLPANGYYEFTVRAVVQMATALSYHRVSAVIDGSRASGTLTIEGTQTDLPGGDGTGLTLTLSATSGSLRANLANATGETVNGYVNVGWIRSDLPT